MKKDEVYLKGFYTRKQLESFIKPNIMKHTPAPWNFEFTQTNAFTVYKKVDGKDSYFDIAYLMTDQQLKSEEQSANAQLISAAPELLEVCQKVLNEWHSNIKNSQKKEPEYLEPMRKAINKATN